jgi:uncharacterized protein (TIGR02246 family)
MVLSVLLAVSTALLEARSLEAIRALPPRFVDRWSQADASGLAALFAPEGDLVIPTGATLAGRDAIEAFYSSVFASGYRGTRVEFALTGLRVFEERFAILDGSFAIVRPDRGEERGRFCAILGKDGEDWRILGLREMVPAS